MYRYIFCIVPCCSYFNFNCVSLIHLVSTNVFLLGYPHFPSRINKVPYHLVFMAYEGLLPSEGNFTLLFIFAEWLILYLNQACKVFSIDIVVCLQVDFSQLAGPYRVVFGVELVKAVKCLSSLGIGKICELCNQPENIKSLWLWRPCMKPNQITSTD